MTEVSLDYCVLPDCVGDEIHVDPMKSNFSFAVWLLHTKGIYHQEKGPAFDLTASRLVGWNFWIISSIATSRISTRHRYVLLHLGVTDI